MEGFSKSQVDKAGRLLASDNTKTVGEVEDAVEVVDWWRAEHQRPLLAVSANLFRYVSDEGEPVIAQRLKRVPAIIDKLARQKSMRLTQMEDVGGVRVVLRGQDTAYRIARLLIRNWTITNSHDYVVEPKADGYRALHLINRYRGRLIEIQLRTIWQDDWANQVESADQLFPGLKAGGGPVEIREFFMATAGLAARRDRGEKQIPGSRWEELEEILEEADTVARKILNEP